MPEQPYQNREIDSKFADIKDALERIEAQTVKTNGTVKWLTKMIWLAIGFCSCLAIIVLPLAWSLIQAGKI